MTNYRVYVATELGGVYYSSDFALTGTQPTWTAVNTGLPSTDVRQFEVPHMHPYRETYQFCILEATRGIYRRDTSGAWTLILTTVSARAYFGLAGGSLQWVATDQALPGVVYALLSFEGFGATHGLYILKSTDWGSSWVGMEIVSNTDFAFIHNASNIVARNGHVWVGGNAGGATGAGRVFYSDDGGASWAWTDTLGSSDWAPKVFMLSDVDDTVYTYDLDSMQYGFIKVENDLSFAYVRGAGLNDGPTGYDQLWTNPNLSSLYQRDIIGNSLYYTDDAWATEHLHAASFVYVSGIFAAPQENSYIVGGRSSVSPNSSIATIIQNGTGPWNERAGNMWGTAPYTASIPKPAVSGDVSAWGIQFVAVFEDQEPVSDTCYVTMLDSVNSVAARYFARLRNQSGTVVAIFDSWLSLEYGRTVDEVDYAVLQLDGNDSRKLLFELDGQFEIYRSIPGCDVDWYRDFIGLFRTPNRKTDSTNRKVFTAYFVGLNDLLARTTIGYKGGTIRAEKSDAAETVMKEYVYENCGAGATVANGREYDGVLPYFYVDTDDGDGATWSGSCEFANLLDVLKDIANTKNIDFNVEYTGLPEFTFRTYVDQLGSDRTRTGLDTTTGRNAAGNVPIVFTIPMGNVQDMEYTLDRRAEANVVYVLGKGEKSTKTIVVRTNLDAIADSPWNRREISRSGSSNDYIYQLNQAGDSVLKEMQAKEEFGFTPLQQPNCLYGLHYFLGDRIELEDEEISRTKRLLGAKIVVAENKQNIALKFADIPTP